MINVIIVEDSEQDALALKNALDRYGRENDLSFSVRHYESALVFLAEYKSGADIIFMDVELTDIDGVEASRRLREKDGKAVLLFVSNMIQYALKGYEVDALDFIQKPLQYYGFNLKMKKAMKIIESYSDQYVMLTCGSARRRVSVRDISYVEVAAHQLFFHIGGEVVQVTGSLKDVEEKLSKSGFARCNSCYLVNLRNVTEVDKLSLVVDGERLQVSRNKRKAFMKALADFYGGGVLG